MNDNLTDQSAPGPKSSKKKLLALVLAIIIIGVLISGWWYFRSRQTPPPPLTAWSPPEKITHELIVPLLPQTSTSFNGRANIIEKDFKTIEISIYLDPFTTKNPQAVATTVFPVQIRSGSCPKPGEVKFPLADIASTSSQTKLSTNLGIIRQMEPLSIAVQQSASESGVFIACGNLP